MRRSIRFMLAFAVALIGLGVVAVVQRGRTEDQARQTPAAATSIRDVAYGTDERQRYDVYVPGNQAVARS
ncbi:MAG: hypothetical protein AAGC53_23575 [Actinomycetota bacterium]